MHDLSLADFVHAPAMQARLAALPSMHVAPPRCLLFGPPRSGKTSLLFQFAFHLASKGREVWMLCDREKLDQTPPLLPLSADRNHVAYSRIKFKYVHDLQQLKAFGACMHLLQELPAAVLVDDLSGLLVNSKTPDRRARDAELNKALAFLIDGLEQLREQRSVEVLLVVSDVGTADGSSDAVGIMGGGAAAGGGGGGGGGGSGSTSSAAGTGGSSGGGGGAGGPGLMYLLQRWFPLILSVTVAVAGGGGGHIWALQVAPNRKQVVSEAVARAAVHYSLMQSYLHVESLAT